MERKKLIELLIKYKEKNLSASELASLQDFLAHEHNDALLIDVLEELSPMEDPMHIAPIKQEQMFAQIWNGSRSDVAPKALRKKKNILTIGSIAAAALLLIILQLNGRLYFNSETNPSKELATTQIIVPGSAKAKLVLDNGVTLDLENLPNDTTLTLNGYKIHKNENGELAYTLTENSPGKEKRYNTIITPKGGEYHLNLPDGTSIWVNSSSTIKYPLQFDQTKREVELDGEAYFEVAKRKNKEQHVPFYVYTSTQILEVLGTSFNINSYKDDIQTTLVEGKVKLTYPDKKEHYLSPNQQSTFNKNSNFLAIKDIDPLYFTAWKNGTFAFDNASMEDVMTDLSRWYEIQVDYQTDVNNLKFSGTISKYEQIEKVLKLIEMTGSIHFKIQERRIIVMK